MDGFKQGKLTQKQLLEMQARIELLETQVRNMTTELWRVRGIAYGSLSAGVWYGLIVALILSILSGSILSSIISLTMVITWPLTFIIVWRSIKRHEGTMFGAFCRDLKGKV